MEMLITGRVKPFSEVKRGKVFRVGAGTSYEVYLKTEEITTKKGERPYNAVELKTGYLGRFAEDSMVEIPRDAQCITKW